MIHYLLKHIGAKFRHRKRHQFPPCQILRSHIHGQYRIAEIFPHHPCYDLGAADLQNRGHNQLVLRQQALEGDPVAFPRFGQNTGVGHQFAQRNRLFTAGQLRLRRGDKDRLLRLAKQDLPVRAVLLLIHKIDKVNVIAAHHFQQAIRGRGHHHSLDQRKLAVKVGNQVGDHRSTQRFHRPDAQRSLRFRRRADNIFRAFCRLHHLPGLLQKSLSRRRKADRAADPFKQRDAQLGFQLADLYRDGGLGVSQLLRGMGKILQFRHPQKSRNVTQFHLCSPLMHFRHSITNIYGMVNKN